MYVLNIPGDLVAISLSAIFVNMKAALTYSDREVTFTDSERGIEGEYFELSRINIFI